MVKAIFWTTTFVYEPETLKKAPNTEVPPGERVEESTVIVSIVKSPFTVAPKSIKVASLSTEVSVNEILLIVTSGVEAELYSIVTVLSTFRSLNDLSKVDFYNFTVSIWINSYFS